MSINTNSVNVDNGFILKSAPNLQKVLAQAKNEATNELGDNKKIDVVNQKQNVQKANIAEEMANADSQNKLSSEEVEKALEIIASFLSITSKNVAFSSDNQVDRTMITVTDKDTLEVINKFPSEKIISIAEKIQALHKEFNNISGLLIDSHV